MPRSRHPTACFLTRYTLIVFKYGTCHPPHTVVVYAHQASIFRSLEARRKLILYYCSRFYTKDALIKNKKQTTVINMLNLRIF